MAFLIATGDYLTPQLVGGLDGTMFGSIIVSEFGFAANWPLGAAMALTLLAVVLLLLATVARLARGQGVLE
jgi:spermidine/putrescine transport system permease protein